MKKRIIIASALMIILIILLFTFKFVIQPYITKKKFEENIVALLNENGKSSIVSKGWLEYAKSKKLEEYDISGLINDYINAIDLAIQKKINWNKEIRYDQYNKSGGLDVVAEHGIQDNWIEYIANNITEEDILAYTENSFFENLIPKIEKVFIHKSEQKDKSWYVKNDMDKTIELPYNVYYVYVSDHKKLRNEVKEIVSIDTNKVNEHYTDCKVKYKNYSDEIVEETIKMFNSVNMYTGEKTYFYSDFSDLYYTDGNMPELTAGQHDYDEAKKRESEELNEFFAEQGRLGREMTPKMNWDDYDENGNYKSEESVISVEQYERAYDWAVKDLQKKALEFKSKDIKEGNGKADGKDTKNDNIDKKDFDDYRNDDDLINNGNIDIDGSDRYQREMIRRLREEAKKSFNESKK